MDEDLDSAFVNEIAQSQRMMRAYLAKILANSSSTDDVLQESNKVIWVKRADWDPETPFLKWAYRICYFQAKAFIRDMGRERLVFREELLEVLAEEHPRDESGGPREQALIGCLQKLRQKDRKLVLGHYDSKENLGEVAVHLGVPANTLSQRLRRIRIQLHDCIQRTLTTYSS